jgi:predicted AlkP superfamily pyrophosphatase or phosphodiesterase
MNAIFIASGYGINPGARPGQIANVDVAPTIASLLGLTMGDIDGRRLEAVLGQLSPVAVRSSDRRSIAARVP